MARHIFALLFALLFAQQANAQLFGCCQDECNAVKCGIAWVDACGNTGTLGTGVVTSEICSPLTLTDQTIIPTSDSWISTTYILYDGFTQCPQNVSTDGGSVTFEDGDCGLDFSLDITVSIIIETEECPAKNCVFEIVVCSPPVAGCFAVPTGCGKIIKPGFDAKFNK